MRRIAASSETLAKKNANGRLVVRRVAQARFRPRIIRQSMRAMGTHEHGSREAAASSSPAWAKAA